MSRHEATEGGSIVTHPPQGDVWLPLQAVVREARDEGGGARTLVLELETPALRRWFTFRPGQYNMVGLPGIGEAAISISSDPAVRGRVEHTVRPVGGVTSLLAGLRPGGVVGIRGPFGNAWPMEEGRGRNILLVAGGNGLAALRPAVEEICRRRRSYGGVTLLYGARTPADLLFTADLVRWQSRDVLVHMSVDTTGGEPWSGHVGLVTTMLDQVVLAPERTLAMVCGPEPMMRTAVSELLTRGLPSKMIFLSLERRMRCGVAQCGHCFLGPKFVCRDGPVFRHADLQGLWAEGV